MAFGIALFVAMQKTILAFFKFVKYLFTIYSYLFLPVFVYFCPTLLTWHGSCFVKFILVRVAWRISLVFVRILFVILFSFWLRLFSFLPCYLPSLTSFYLFLVLILVKFTNRTGTTMLDEKKSSVSYCFYYILYYYYYFTSVYFLGMF